MIGPVAQLGERLHGMQEVGGSIPPRSTRFMAEVYTKVDRIVINTPKLSVEWDYKTIMRRVERRRDYSMSRSVAIAETLQQELVAVADPFDLW